MLEVTNNLKIYTSKNSKFIQYRPFKTNQAYSDSATANLGKEEHKVPICQKGRRKPRQKQENAESVSTDDAKQ